MNREDGACFFRDGGLNEFDINIEGLRIDIDEHGSGAHIGNGFRRGDKSKGGGDHLVPLLDAGGTQSQMQGIRTGAHTDGVLHSAISSHLLFKSPYVGAKDEQG